MPDDRDERILSALRAEAASASLTLTDATVLERLARPPESPWARLVGLGLAGAALLVLLAVILVPQARFGADATEPVQLEPSVALPAPYDWGGIRSALGPRGLVIEIPTDAEAAGAGLSPNQAVDIVRAQYEEEPGVTLISLHLATVTNEDERLPLSGVLMYVAESTGHDTGNCFTLVGADMGEPVIGACFYAERSQPYPSMPVGTYQANKPIGKTCLALILKRDADGLLLPRARDLRGQWWDVGAGGDCSTTSSSVISTSVQLTSAAELAIELPLMSGDAQRILIEFVDRFDGGFNAVVTSGDERVEITFNTVTEIDPIPAPIGGEVPDPSAVSTPDDVRNRSELPFCGHEVVERTVEGGDLYDAEARACFWAAHEGGEPAELISEGLTVEGGRITQIWRLLPSGALEIFTDATQDPLSTPEWTRVRCASLVDAGREASDGAGLFQGENCEDPEVISD